MAHRGASADAPENTLEAFHLAVQQGCDAFELDVRLTRDGEAVLMHDPTLLRTCAHPGEVAVMTLAQIRAADAGAGYLAPDGTRPWHGRGVVAPLMPDGGSGVDPVSDPEDIAEGIVLAADQSCRTGTSVPLTL